MVPGGCCQWAQAHPAAAPAAGLWFWGDAWCRFDAPSGSSSGCSCRGSISAPGLRLGRRGDVTGSDGSYVPAPKGRLCRLLRSSGRSAAAGSDGLLPADAVAAVLRRPRRLQPGNGPACRNRCSSASPRSRWLRIPPQRPRRGEVSSVSTFPRNSALPIQLPYMYFPYGALSKKACYGYYNYKWHERNESGDGERIWAKEAGIIIVC